MVLSSGCFIPSFEFREAAVVADADGLGALDVAADGLPDVLPDIETSVTDVVGVDATDSASDTQDSGAACDPATCPTVCTRGSCLAVTSLSAGSAHTCASMSNGDTYCWGSNARGQIGVAGASRVTPTLVAVGSASAVSAGSLHTCALLLDHTITCWGDNAFNQLAAFAASTSIAPVPIAGTSGATLIACGEFFSCAATTAGVVCWGNNSFDQSGYYTGARVSVPATVMGLGDTRALSLGSVAACAVDSAGQAACWGSDLEGELGDMCSVMLGAMQTSSAVAVAPPGSWHVLSSGSETTCGLTTGDALRCWGTESNGEFADGAAATMRCMPAQSGAVGDTWNLLGLGGQHGCAQRTADDQLFCWGANSMGELGNGTTTPAWAPSMVRGIQHARLLAAGAHHTCAAVADGSVWCWGQNADGELGDGTMTQRLMPVRVRW